MPRKRKWLPDEFALPQAPQKIKPLRAPRMGPVALANLPAGGQELLDAMTKVKTLIEQNANDGSIELALGELRGTIAYVRARWKYSAANVERAHKSQHRKLVEKHGETYRQPDPHRRVPPWA